MEIKEIEREVLNLNMEELVLLNGFCVDVINERRGVEDRRQIRTLCVGQKVNVIRGGEVGFGGVVRKINKKTVIVENSQTGERWRVSASLVRRV